MNLIKNIRKLRILAFFLFLIPAMGLLGSLIFHNYLLSFEFEKSRNYIFSKDEPGETFSILCDESNNFCSGPEENFKKLEKLNTCHKYKIYFYFTNIDGDKLNFINENQIRTLDQKVFLKYELVNELDNSCILNSDKFIYYKIFPFFFENIYNLKFNKKTVMGTSGTVNPFFYGETSISNIVKRFPINYFFKTLLYLTVLLMVMYWIYYNLILKKITSFKKNFYFLYFGILSSIFLLLHVFFLGWVFENEFLTKLRRSFVVFFIFFEILSQAFLINKILEIKKSFFIYFKNFVITLKLLFVLLICSSTILILLILIFYDFSPKVDYILEWNYFLILLFFYLLSFFMWKKN